MIYRLYPQLLAIIIMAATSLVTIASFKHGAKVTVAEQKRYDEFRVGLVLQDLQSLPNLDNSHSRKMQIKGSIVFSPVVERMAERYKVLRRLVSIRLHSGMPFGEYYLYLYFNLPGVIHQPNWSSKKLVINDKDLLIHLDTAYHTIKYDNNSVVVVLKQYICLNNSQNVL